MAHIRNFFVKVCLIQRNTRMVSTSSVHLALLANCPKAHLDSSILESFRILKSSPNYDASKVRATYLWIDGSGENLRSKDRFVKGIPTRAEDVPKWQYDGSSTGQASRGNSDITMVPRVIYPDPFKIGEYDVVVLCDTYTDDGEPTPSNKRYLMQDAVNKTLEHEPWFGVEQEYTFLDANGWPCGWPDNGYPAPEGPYCKH